MLNPTPHSPGTGAAQDNAVLLCRRILKPSDELIVVAHRGCHNVIPSLSLRTRVPENSLPALDRCAQLAVHMMEADVRRTRDGRFVIIHDETIDRTTNGSGLVRDMTLNQIRSFRLRAGDGGPAAPLTDAVVPTLEELLASACNKVVLNLDVKEPIYPEVADAVVRAGATERVLLKAPAASGTVALSDIEPFSRMPFVPMLQSCDGTGEDLAEVALLQSMAKRRPTVYEAPHMDMVHVSPLAATAHSLGARLWVNTLFEGFVNGLGGDIEALRDPQAVWGWLMDAGVTMIQTDEPDALLTYARRRVAV